MSKYLYAVMYKENTGFLGEAANYVEDKVVLKGLTEAEISMFTGDINRVDAVGFNPDNDAELTGLSIAQLSGIIDGLVSATPNDKLAIFSIPQGKWIHANHPAFAVGNEEI